MDDALRWKRLRHLAARNHNVVTTRMISDAGLALSTFYDYAQRHGATQRHRGVWTIPGTTWSFVVQATAALAAVGQPSMITGDAGLHLRDVLRRRPESVTVVVPHHRRPSGHQGVRVVRVGDYESMEERRHHGLRLATIEQCLKQSSMEHSTDELARLMAAACRLRLTDLERLGAYTATGTFPGKRSWKAAISALRGEMVHSNPEKVARAALRRDGLCFEPAPYTVRRHGRPIAEIDIAWPEILYGVEVDGPHHLLEEQRRRDIERDRELRNDGWRIDRYFWDDVLGDPTRFARSVGAAVGALYRQPGTTLQCSTGGS